MWTWTQGCEPLHVVHTSAPGHGPKGCSWVLEGVPALPWPINRPSLASAAAKGGLTGTFSTSCCCSPRALIAPACLSPGLQRAAS